MSPASRTPEGTPIDCPICGRSAVVTPSTPPGDCVCPHCGTLLWVPTGKSHVKIAVRSFLGELQSLVQSDDSLQYTTGFLVAGLKNCLAAHGAALWINPKRKLWRRSQLRLQRNDGPATTPELASEVVAAAAPIVRQESTATNRWLHLGVPMARDGKVLGVLEVAQRDVEDERTQLGYVRFISQVAGISLPLAIRLQDA